MKRFSAQYIITNSGTPLKRAIITTTEDGTIVGIEDTQGSLYEEHSVEFYNGIIIPGFVNCHCHLELSHMKEAISCGTGLTGFIDQVRNTRVTDNESIIRAAKAADKDMYAAGVNLCADICNTSLTFEIKKESEITYHNFLEVFGIDPAKADRRMAEIIKIAEIADEMNLAYSIVPHSVYSLSLTLFRLLREASSENRITSIHFMETPGEAELVENHSGPLMSSYLKSGLITSGIEAVKSHSDAILNEITRKGNLILVHNTFANQVTIREIGKRKNLYWCLCPNSNRYIENMIPPADLLIDEECIIVAGTDSLASNDKLDMLEELKTLQHHFPSLTIETLVTWATLNGAKALGEEDRFGVIGPGKRPGLLLLQDVDLQNMRLLPGSSVKRLV
ncbi:MAG: amidohydrolase family protein [Bacteroidales bacterium]|nr:amidohydrolase family protein [Bacteroidales bacterium]MBK8881225.1 amidohydrolase family protein [Bacteroidales bacterium]